MPKRLVGIRLALHHGQHSIQQEDALRKFIGAYKLKGLGLYDSGLSSWGCLIGFRV